MLKASEYCFNQPADDLAARAALGGVVPVERADHFVHFYGRRGEFGTVAGFARAHVFILAFVDFLLPDHHLAFVAVSAGAAQIVSTNRHSSGRVLVHRHRHSGGLPDFPAVSVATNAAAG